MYARKATRQAVLLWPQRGAVVGPTCILFILKSVTEMFSHAGELFFYGYNVKRQPHVTYKVASREGKVQSHVPITIPRGIMMHDFAITRDYAVFLDCPMVFKPEVGNCLALVACNIGATSCHTFRVMTFWGLWLLLIYISFIWNIL